MQLRGAKTMQKKLQQLARRAPDRIGQALRLEAEAIMTRSKREFVPVDLGVLRSSGHVQDVQRSGRDVSVTLAFGGAAEAYALPVHEHPSEHSPPSWGDGDVAFSPGGRGPKYLERPMREAIRGMADRIGERVLDGISDDAKG
jgi:hypothetical protein